MEFRSSKWLRVTVSEEPLRTGSMERKYNREVDIMHRRLQTQWSLKRKKS
jgi:hypothetical protein